MGKSNWLKCEPDLKKIPRSVESDNDFIDPERCFWKEHFIGDDDNKKNICTHAKPSYVYVQWQAIRLHDVLLKNFSLKWHVSEQGLILASNALSMFPSPVSPPHILTGILVN